MLEIRNSFEVASAMALLLSALVGGPARGQGGDGGWHPVAAAGEVHAVRARACCLVCVGGLGVVLTR